MPSLSGISFEMLRNASSSNGKSRKTRKSNYGDTFSEWLGLMRDRFNKPRNITPSKWNAYVLCATHKATRWIKSDMNTYCDEVVADVAAFLTNKHHNQVIFNIDYIDEDIIEEMEDVMNNNTTNNSTSSFVDNTSSYRNQYDSDDNDSDSDSDTCDSEDDY